MSRILKFTGPARVFREPGRSGRSILADEIKAGDVW
jgi:dihydroxyacid dehydratase/phosphogluconate dehydratase